MTTPANRLLTLVLLLQRQPNQKAASLAASLGVSVRTLHRYIKMLEEMGIPVYTEHGPYGGFSLVRGFKMPPLVFSPEEATTVALGTGLVEEIWGEMYREATQSALVKLENLLPSLQMDEVKWARRSMVAAGLLRPGLNAQTGFLAKIRQAMRKACTVKTIYQSGSSRAPATRMLDPYALVFRWGWWYVVGFCHTRRAIRTFRVDRVLELALTAEYFLAPGDFDAREFLARTAWGKPQVQARIRFFKQAGNLALMNRTAWDALEEQSDGSVVVTFSAPDLNWAASSILAYGPAAEVLEPPELRHLVREWAGAIVKLYSMKGE